MTRCTTCNAKLFQARSIQEKRCEGCRTGWPTYNGEVTQASKDYEEHLLKEAPCSPYNDPNYFQD